MAKIGEKTLSQIKVELDELTDNHWKQIKKAFDQGAGVTVNYKIDLDPTMGQVAIRPTISFYPIPKYKSEGYEVLVDEDQQGLTFGNKKGGK